MGLKNQACVTPNPKYGGSEDYNLSPSVLGRGPDVKCDDIPQVRIQTGSLLSSCCCCCLVIKSCLTLSQPHGVEPIRLLLSMGFPRQESWRGLSFPPAVDLPDPGIGSGTSCTDGQIFFFFFLTIETPGKLHLFSLRVTIF